jgi:hypothetical protein
MARFNFRDPTMQEVALCFSILLSGILIGFGVIVFLEIRESKALYRAKLADLEAIMKAASDANMSIADKILQIEEKLNTMEFWRASVLKGK